PLRTRVRASTSWPRRTPRWQSLPTLTTPRHGHVLVSQSSCLVTQRVLWRRTSPVWMLRVVAQMSCVGDTRPPRERWKKRVET
ncbi:hypothetical protein COCVIDRAFT_96236, partial [Bipolaris victoriae FI3]